ncbi:NUDIX domain-containing protein [Streptomyces sp. NPDC086091]|uniref:NUDIX domain-containing protein n=1 Tax=Streptomyces sp. NPDC086091 TaxID=3365751 RepID=UPI0037F6D1EC
MSKAQWLAASDTTSPTLRAKLLQARLDGHPEPVNASALIHDGNGRYLLHLRDHKPGVIWQSGAFALLGGGRTHDDRSLRDTLLRELSEEVPDQGNPDRLRLYEGVLLHWFTPDELNRLRMSPATQDVIRRHAAASTSGRAHAIAPSQEHGEARSC